MNYKQAVEKLRARIDALIRKLADPATPPSQHSGIIREITVLHNELIRISEKKLSQSTDSYEILGGSFKNIIKTHLAA